LSCTRSTYDPDSRNDKAGLSIKGVNYDVGTEYRVRRTSRAAWRETDVANDMAAISSELNCSDVNLSGTDLIYGARPT